jgi:hypothetical protein
MVERISSKSSPKAVCSVSYLAQILGLSRSRLYQLIDAGIFPPPLYDLRSKRPFYDLPLQERCREIRNSGIAFNNNYVLFYSSRKQKATPVSKLSLSQNEHIQEIREALEQMGLEASRKQISDAIAIVFPEGIGNQDTGLILRELFRHFKNKV